VLLVLASIVLSALGCWIIEAALHRLGDWLRGTLQGACMLVFLSMASIWVFLQLTLGVWIWAVHLWRLGIFDALELAVSFAVVAFTKLGLGNILLPSVWRLLGGVTAVNGLLNVCLVTAILAEFLRRAHMKSEAA